MDNDMSKHFHTVTPHNTGSNFKHELYCIGLNYTMPDTLIYIGMEVVLLEILKK